jgi:DNA-binding transcriptional MerR regulator
MLEPGDHRRETEEKRVGEDRLPIDDVAARTGLSVHTIQRLTAERLVTAQDGYSAQDVDRLFLLKHAEPFTWSSREVRELMALLNVVADSASFPAQRGQALDRLEMFQDAVDERCDALSEELNTAETFARLLRAQISDAREEMDS